MNLCDKEHQQVCFEGRYCPVCEELTKVASLEEQIQELRYRIEEMQETIDELN